MILGQVIVLACILAGTPVNAVVSPQASPCKCGTDLDVTPGFPCDCDISFDNTIIIKGTCYFILPDGCTQVPKTACSVTGTITATGPFCPTGGQLTLMSICGGTPVVHLEHCPFPGADTVITFTCKKCPGAQ